MKSYEELKKRYPNPISPNDYFIRHKKHFVKLTILFAILSAIILPITVVFWFKLDAIHPKYQKVKADVVSVYDAKFGNDVYVRYNNEEYKLINVKDGEFFIYDSSLELKRPVEVLLGEDGQLYANTDGIRNETPTGKMYFVFLLLSFILIPATIILYSCIYEAKVRQMLLDHQS